MGGGTRPERLKMRTLSDKVVKGKRRVTVELDEGEQLIGVHEGEHYRLGEPLDSDVILGHQLVESQQVYWCIVEQKWKES